MGGELKPRGLKMINLVTCGRRNKTTWFANFETRERRIKTAWFENDKISSMWASFNLDLYLCSRVSDGLNLVLQELLLALGEVCELFGRLD